MRLKSRLALAMTMIGMSLFLTLLLYDVAPRPVPAGRLDRSDQLESSLTAADTSGHSAQNVTHRLCVIVPFRDRFQELLAFVPYMSKYLAAQKITFVILVMQQIDGYRFNRASLINVGYFESKRLGCDYMAMHDVDLVPLNFKEISYAFPGDTPVHIASPDYHPRYSYPTFIGGILLISLEQYLRVNGMSNRYWGWGMEDDELYVRLRRANLLPRRPVNLSTNRTNTFVHMHSSINRPRDSAKYFNQRNVSKWLDRVSGVKNVNYTVSSRNQVTIEGYPATIVNVLLHCDHVFSPWCKAPERSTNSTKR